MSVPSAQNPDEHNVVSYYIDHSSIVTHLGELCNELIKDLPKDGPKDEMINYVESFWNKKHDLSDLVTPVAKISLIDPISSLNKVLQSFPLVNPEEKDINKYIKDSRKISFAGLLTNIDWENISSRLCIRSVVELLYSNYIQVLLSLLEPIPEDIAIRVIMFFKSLISANESKLGQQFHFISSKYFSRCIYLMSYDNTDKVIENFILSLENVSSISKYRLCSILCMYSEIRINKRNKFDPTKFENTFISLYQVIKNVPCKHPLHLTSLSCITNFCGCAFACWSSLTNSKFLFETSELAKHFQTMPKYFGIAFDLRALTYIFSTHKKLSRSLFQYCKRYIDPLLNKPECGGMILRTYIIFLRGLNYETKRFMTKNGLNYEWKPPPAKVSNEFINYMVMNFCTNVKTFSEFPSEIHNFFAQICAIDQEKFFADVFPSLLKKNILDNATAGILLLFRTFLSPVSKLLISTQLKENVSKIINKILPSMMKEMTKNVIKGKPFAFNNTPIKFYYQKFLMNNDELIFYLEKTAKPISPSIKCIKDISPQLTKWQIGIGLKSIPFQFMQSKITLRLLLENQKCDRKYIVAISLSPYIEFTEENLIILTNLILSANPMITAIALRAIETILLQKIELSHIVIECLLKHGKTKVGLRRERLYNVIYSIKRVITIMKIKNYQLKEEILKNLHIVVAIGDTSSDNLTRILSLEISRTIGKYAHSEIEDHLIKNEINISNYAQTIALLAISKKRNHNFSHFPLISFSDSASSMNNILHSFYIASYSKSLIGEIKDSLICELLDSLIKLLEKTIIDEVNFHHYANIAIFIINLMRSDNGYDKISTALNLCEICSNYIIENDKTKEVSLEMLFCSVHHSIYNNIIKFETGNPLLLDAIAFSIRVKAIQSDFFNKYNEDEIQLYYERFNFIIDHVDKLEIVSKVANFQCNGKKAIKICRLTNLLKNLFLSMSLVFESIYENTKTNTNGPFSRNICLSTYQLSTENKERWYPFIINFMADTSPRVVINAASSAFRFILMISTPPDSCTHIILDHITTFNALIVPQIFTIYYPYLLPKFISNSLSNKSDNALHFDSIYKQFKAIKEPKKIISYWKTNMIQNLSDVDYEFTQSTFNNIGSLLAVAFYYMTDPSMSGWKMNSFYLFNNLTLACAAILNKPKFVNSLIKKIQEADPLLETRLSQLTKRVTYELSELISQYMSFCTEQFVADYFLVIQNHSECNELISVVLPWIKNVHIDYESPIVFNCDINFVKFTPYTFILALINLPTDPSTYSLINQIIKDDPELLRRLTVLLIMMNLTNQTMSQHIESILIYLLSIYSNEVSGIFLSILRVKSWFYFNIQISGNENSAELSKYLSVNESDNDSSDEELKVSLIDHFSPEKELMRLWELAINVMTSAIQDRNDLLRDYSPTLLSFILISFPVYGLDASYALHDIIPDFNYDIYDSENFIIDFINGFEENKKIEFGENCLGWGLACGDLNIAIRGLGMYKIVLEPCNTDIINSILKSISIISDLMKESIEKGIVISDSVSSYIVVCFIVIKEILNKLNVSRTDIYWTAASFLNSVSDKQIEICEQALELMIKVIEIPDSQVEMNLVKERPNNMYFLNQVSELEFSAEMIHTVFCYLIQISKTKLFNLVYQYEKAPEMTAILIIIFTYMCMIPGQNTNFFSYLSSSFDDTFISSTLEKFGSAS